MSRYWLAEFFMGIDASEIALGIEHRLGVDLRSTFKGIRNEEKDAELRMAFSTAGSLHAFVLERIAGTPGWRWPADRMFQLFRERWVIVSGQSAEFIRMETLLDDLFLPPRRKGWLAFGRAAGLSMPQLGRSYLGESAFFLSAVIATLAVITVFVVFRWQTVALAVASVAGMIAVGMFTRIELPKNCYNVGQLVQRLTERNRPGKKAIGEAAHPSPEEVWTVLQGILVEVLVVPREKVTPQARLVQDLGMG